jgi:hypothetical protein
MRTRQARDGYRGRLSLQRKTAGRAESAKLFITAASYTLPREDTHLLVSSASEEMSVVSAHIAIDMCGEWK